MPSNTYIAKYAAYSNKKLQIEDYPDTYTRSHISGANNRTRHAPYISGYWYLALIPPRELLNNDDALVVKYVRAFNSSAESYAPPSRNITKQEVVAFGGIKKFLAISQEFSNSFSITFREQGNLGIFNLITHWSGLIHPFTGKHNKIYKGQCVIVLAKPTFSGGSLDNPQLIKPDVEEVFYFDGVFPESQPVDKFDANIESLETKQVDVTFNFDGAFMNKIDYTDEVKGESFLNVFNEYVGELELHEAHSGALTKVQVENDEIGI
jgi:hypothetical protein